MDSTKPVFLINLDTNQPIPLISTRFNVEITQGFANMTIHQIYENNTDHPLETLFMMPYSDTFSLNQIDAEFTLSNGTTENIITKVTERQKAVAQYNDALATGKTAVMSYKENTENSKSMLRVVLGNFPPKSKAYLKASCS